MTPWRVIYSNIVGVGWGELEARLNLAFDEDLGRPAVKVREELVVAMPHRTAKMLAHALSAIVANYEAHNGVIPIPGEKLQEIDSAVKAQAFRGKQPEK